MVIGLALTRQDDGRDDLTQPIRPVEAERSKRLYPRILGWAGIREVLVNFIGPGQVWIVARVEIDDDLRGGQVESLVRGVESDMRRESESVYRVDVVPIGADHAGDATFPLRRRSKDESGRPESPPPKG